LADAAVGGQPVRIRLSVWRFTCADTSCARRTFAEQVEGLTVRYGRHSLLLRAMLQRPSSDRVKTDRDALHLARLLHLG
jgi:hypothetical protein